jgi:hypothetical protein
LETNPALSSTPPVGEPIPSSPEKIGSNGHKNGILLPVVLFLATCISTFWTGATDWAPYTHLDKLDQAFSDFWQNLPQGVGASLRLAVTEMDLNWPRGFAYMGGVWAILLIHELGHFVVARRYRIPTTLPYWKTVPSIVTGCLTLD